MTERALATWGGVSALVFVLLLSISIASAWITGGIAFAAWVPLFSTALCFLLVAALAGYDYLKEHDKTAAMIGLAFGFCAIVMMFLEAAVWSANRALLPSTGSASAPGPTPFSALFGSLHLMVLWFVGLWMASWGIGFLRRGEHADIGIPMLLVAVVNAGTYSLARLGMSGSFVDYWQLIGQLMLLGAFVTLGRRLLRVGARAPDPEADPGSGRDL